MIRLEHVSFTYPSGTKALDDVTLTIDRGELICLIGGNGCGKSTLAKLINALYTPEQGSVRICSMDTNDPDKLLPIRSRVGMVFQNPEDQLVATPVANEVAFGPENLGLDPEEIRARVKDSLDAVGLSGFEARDTASLSGGQKQRLAIAGALAMHPDVLVLDEASAMLDPQGRTKLMEVCHALHEKGLTIVMITHFMEDAAQADRVIALDRGRIAFQGRPEEVLADELTLAKLGLSAPFPTRLAHALHERGIPVPSQIHTRQLIESIRSLREEACSF